ncbi:hypothetical protein ABZX93_05385 [Streptomyces sp. NPDC006632]|uniref:hypothetical protein n=1 Tax=Streptomyces sp. NPDC006632 TaxID=3157182 RepID=UPI0033ADB7FB
MSRKHYRALAAVLRRAYEDHPESKDALNDVTHGVASLCVEDNHHFRRQQFYDAARPETP